MEVLRGRVTSGVGSLSHWMVVFEDLYRAKTGADLYPGSLNLVLEEPWHVGSTGSRLEPPEYPVPLRIVPCTAGGIDAFIIRTDKNDCDEGDHAPNIIEVGAAVRLRDALGVEDGDIVEVLIAAKTDHG